MPVNFEQRDKQVIAELGGISISHFGLVNDPVCRMECLDKLRFSAEAQAFEALKKVDDCMVVIAEISSQLTTEIKEFRQSH